MSKIMFSAMLLISKYMLLVFYLFFKNCMLSYIWIFCDTESHETNVNVPLVVRGTQFDKPCSNVYSNT